MISFDYHCENCGREDKTETMDSMICGCGGFMRLGRAVNGYVFRAYYSPEMKCYISTKREEERALKEHGYSYLWDHRKTQSEADHIRKHKEEYAKAEYAKLGVKYKPYSGQRFDEQKHTMVSTGRKPEFKRTFFSILFLILLSTSAFARIPGVEYATISVDGDEISFPIGNDTRRNEVYYLKKALKGDEDAREVFLGGREERMYYVGDDKALWLRVTSSDEEIINPHKV